MRFSRTELDGVWLIDLDPMGDERGFFARTFCEREFAAHGLKTRFPQHSLSLSVQKGTLRGMHFQRPPHAETKLVACAKGAIFDVAIDLRPGSASFRRWFGVELSAANRRRIYIPEGFAHGFQTLTDDCEIAYLISEFYEPAASTGVRWNDPAFGIDWPLPVSVISDKDRAWPDFAG